MKKSSNIGETGVSSIRLKGQKIDDLPLGLGNQAAEGLQDALETERLNAIAEINAQYPHQRVDYLSARINECEENKNRMKRMIADTNARIQEYRGLLMKCGVRDRMLNDLLDRQAWVCEDESEMSDEYKAEKKKILTEWGRWDANELAKQIEQDEEALERFEDVIGHEDESIKEHSEMIALCRERDKQLAKLGAKAEGS